MSAWDHEGRGQGQPLPGGPETPSTTTIHLTHPTASDLRPAQQPAACPSVPEDLPAGRPDHLVTHLAQWMITISVAREETGDLDNWRLRAWLVCVTRDGEPLSGS